MKSIIYDRSFFAVLLSLLITVSLLLVGAEFSPMLAENQSGSTKISLNISERPLSEVMATIESSTGCKFVYNNNELDINRLVSIKAENEEVLSILRRIIPEANISLRDNNFVVSKLYDKSTKDQLVPEKDDVKRHKKTIRGKITDEEGESIPYADIVVKGKSIGTASDEYGKYEITVDDGATLVFSFLGFKDFEARTAGKDIINVTLEKNNITLDEVVVVGYNSVERKHITSSIESIEVDKIKSRPLMKLQQAFSGTVLGATVMQGTSLPGSVPGTISIRGLSTLQNAEPLVIIDGMEQSLTDIDPNQVRSMHILKDAASASMYGSRGANGVIIIETERGSTGEFRVLLNNWASISSPMDLPDFVGAADYMTLNNEARLVQGQPMLFSAEDIDNARTGKTKSVDWMKEVMQRPAHAFNTSANISGGGGAGTFNLMLGSLTENGLNSAEGSQKFSARFNTNINIADRFVLLADFSAMRLQNNRLYANSDGHGLYRTVWKMNPTQQIYYESELHEHYILHDNMNPIASINHGGSMNYLYDRSTINLRPRYYITDNLTIEGDASYMINKSAEKYKMSTFKFFDGDLKPVITWPNSVGASQGVSISQITARGMINYESKLRHEKDKIYLVAGSEIMNYNYTDFREVNKASFFGKMNYSFADRYLLEVTLRGDGSSKFAPGHQWGFFPAASLGWNVHNEQFMSSIVKKRILNNLKFRLSWGLIGNEDIEPYLWQEVVNNWGWMMRVPNPDFSWEKQRQWNAGLDLSCLHNKLSITAEVYEKYSYDLIYSDFPVPPLTGAYALTAAVNIGEVQNKGWELAVKWNDKIGDISYNIGIMVFDNRNKVLKAGYHDSDTLVFANNPEKVWYKGIAVDNYYGYKSNGYFKDNADVENTVAKMPNSLPGDIKYVDQNNDGVINEADRINLGDPFPHYNYSINFDISYKRWSFSILGQGVGQRTGRLKGLEGYPVVVDGVTNSLGTPRKYYMDNRWKPDHQNSRFPRVWTGVSNNTELSDVWLSNAAFFRIKNIQLSYNFPKIGRHIRNLSIYGNIQDALTFTKWEGLEPERDGGNGVYPRMRTFCLGVKLTFL